ncbi:MAG: ABC transporter ATP-binding protein [Treponema sp.]|jgi:ABC-type nitrate/sulfonate/bicarbonate transport system ATPase subunit|nr:ABC transporter ATP-binding protein [Treponema sp.]
MKPVFRCENIVKYYEAEPVIKDINLELCEGGFISLLGPSGAGKTTLFNVLAGVDKPDSGKVFLNDEDITGISGRVSYMLQKDLLLEYRTTLDNVILPLLIRGEKKRNAREKAAGFFPMFGLSGYEKKYPCELSGGMRQRAALLRTCMQHNQVLLLDEPFSALDAITRNAMQSWYAGIAAEMKFSTLFITHDVEEALVLSDIIYILNGKPGKITKIINVKENRPQKKDYLSSEEFDRDDSLHYAQMKRLVLQTIS